MPVRPLALLLILAFANGCGRGDDEAARWVVANVHPAGYPTAEGLREWARQVEAAPQLASRMRLDLQLGGVLGGEKETLEKVRFGGLQGACSSVAPLAELVPELGVVALPYLFRDAEHLWAVLDGPVGRELAAALEAAGFVPLAWYDAGARSFYARRPIARLADLRGLEIRVQQVAVMRDTVTALGATPVALGFKEVYTSLHTGAVDGAENNLPSYRSERHFEVARHYAFDRHAMIPDVVLVGKAAWDRLDEGEQRALRRAAEASATTQRRLWRDYEIEARAALRAAGVTFHELDDLAAFRAAVAPVYARHEGAYGGLVMRIRATGG